MTEVIAPRIFSLPIADDMREEDIDRVCTELSTMCGSAAPTVPNVWRDLPEQGGWQAAAGDGGDRPAGLFAADRR